MTAGHRLKCARYMISIIIRGMDLDAQQHISLHPSLPSNGQRIKHGIVICYQVSGNPCIAAHTYSFISRNA